jgi:hypothetical protein
MSFQSLLVKYGDARKYVFVLSVSTKIHRISDARLY